MQSMTGTTNRPPNRTLLIFFCLYFMLHWLTGIFMFQDKLGFSYATVVRYFLGDPDLFMNPRSFAGLLEVSHFHLFAMGFFFVVFTHLLPFTRLNNNTRRWILWLLAVSMLGDMAGGWLIRYIAAEFAWLKLTSFWIMQGSCLLLIIALFECTCHKRHR
jgi:hypothetical protein